MFSPFLYVGVSCCLILCPFLKTTILASPLQIFFLRFYLFERGEGAWLATWACVLTGNQTSNLLVSRPACNPLSHTSQGSVADFPLCVNTQVRASSYLPDRKFSRLIFKVYNRKRAGEKRSWRHRTINYIVMEL